MSFNVSVVNLQLKIRLVQATSLTAKVKGSWRNPQRNLLRLRKVEEIIRANPNLIWASDFVDTTTEFVASSMSMMLQHDDDENGIHGNSLCKLVTGLYSKIRLHHEAEIVSQIDKYIRRIFNKLVQWRGQWIKVMHQFVKPSSRKCENSIGHFRKSRLGTISKWTRLYIFTYPSNVWEVPDAPFWKSWRVNKNIDWVRSYNTFVVEGVLGIKMFLRHAYNMKHLKFWVFDQKIKIDPQSGLTWLIISNWSSLLFFSNVWFAMGT